MAQLDERSELLRPVARNAAANRENSQTFLLEQRWRKIFQILKRIETKTRLALFVTLAIGKRVIQTKFGVGERRHEYWNVLLNRGLQNSALPFRGFGKVRADRPVELVGAHHFAGIPTREYRLHHALHVVEVLLGLERVVDAVVSRLIEFFVAEF